MYLRQKSLMYILILGLIFFALLATPTASAVTEHSGSETIQANQYWYYRVSLPNGGGVEYEIKGNNTMNIYFLDQKNMALYVAGQSFIYIDKGTSLNTQHAKMYFTISNESGGTYYIVVESAGNWPVNFTYDVKYGEDLETSFFDFFGTTTCIIGGVVLLIWLAVLIWVYKDAKRRGKSGLLWFLVVLFLNILGLIIWLIVRPKNRIR